MLLQVLGCGTMSVGRSSDDLGRAGTGGQRPQPTCINMMLTERFAPSDLGESAFLWNYAGMNIGFLSGTRARASRSRSSAWSGWDSR